METKFFPLFVASLITLGRKTIFRTANESVTVEAPHALMQKLIELCDGSRSVEEIFSALKDEWDFRSVSSLMRELQRRGIVVDSRCVGDVVWGVVRNPARFPSSIHEKEIATLVRQAIKRHRWSYRGALQRVRRSALFQLLERRRSVRVFSEKPVDPQSVFDIIWSAYGEIGKTDGYAMDSRRTVPSAGALYPLAVHVAFFRKTGALEPGVYRVHLGHPRSVGFRLVSEDIPRFSRAFLNPILLRNAHGVVVLSGSFSVPGRKYGNRGLLFVPLEAGHAAQNVHLATVERNVASIEVGGFVEELLADAINLPSSFHPLTTVVFGHEEKTAARRVEARNPQVQWAVPMAGQYRLSFAAASARVSEGRNWSHGRDASPEMAYTKAVAEAKEWAACGCVPDDLVCAKLTELETAVDPRSIIRFHPAQYRAKGFPFAPFDENWKYEWAEGREEFTGTVRHILADLVYFPYYPKAPYYAYANSSGVAAHPERAKAVEAATLELVERDSFMNVYGGGLVRPTVSWKTLPERIQKRLAELRKQGFHVWVKDHSLDLAPAVFVFAQSEALVYTTCASCASFDIAYAVDHALMEVEAAVLARLQNGPAKRIAPHEVAMPLDHGRLYEQKRYFRRADFLTDGGPTISLKYVGKGAARSLWELCDRFVKKGWSFITIPLTLSEKFGGNGDLHVVRAIVPGMVPMTFGYRQEPAGMPRIYEMNKVFGDGKLSHRELSKFPHPFA